jgi:starvation-inducible DNA-binding protein
MTFLSPSPLPEDIRLKIVGLLEPVVLALNGIEGIARKAHWNVKGPMFGTLHPLFGELRKAAYDYADVVAEHCSIDLGIPVDGDHVDAAERSSITAMPKTLTQGRDLARAVCDRVTAAIVMVNAPKAELVAMGDDEGQQKLIDVSMALTDISGKILAHIC